MNDSILKDFIRKGREYLDLKNTVTYNDGDRAAIALANRRTEFYYCAEDLLREYLGEEEELRQFGSKYIAMYSEEEDMWLFTTKEHWEKEEAISDQEDKRLGDFLVDHYFYSVTENGYEYDGEEEAESALKDLGFEIIENPFE